MAFPACRMLVIFQLAGHTFQLQSEVHVLQRPIAIIHTYTLTWNHGKVNNFPTDSLKLMAFCVHLSLFYIAVKGFLQLGKRQSFWRIKERIRGERGLLNERLWISLCLPNTHSKCCRQICVSGVTAAKSFCFQSFYDERASAASPTSNDRNLP